MQRQFGGEKKYRKRCFQAINKNKTRINDQDPNMYMREEHPGSGSGFPIFHRKSAKAKYKNAQLMRSLPGAAGYHVPGNKQTFNLFCFIA